MKIVHFLVVLFYLVYSLFNISRFGRGEWLPIIFAVVSLSISRIKFKKNFTGLYLAGMLTGLMVEYITEAYWKYSFNVYIWKDMSLYVVLGWGFTFTFFVVISNNLFKVTLKVWSKIFGKQKPIPVSVKNDPRLILFDACLGIPWFVSYELIGMYALRLWEYRDVAGWDTIVPIINYPLEGIIGAFLFGMILPSFVRFWEPHLKF